MQNAVVVNYSPQRDDGACSNNQPTAIQNSIIWLHGLGASGDDFVPIVPELALTQATRFIFPHAPKLPVTINGGFVMPAWYDIYETSAISRQVDIVHIESSSKRIMQIIDQQIQQGIAPNRIVLAGFSQGGAIAYHVALTCLSMGKTLGGLLAMSTYLPAADRFDKYSFDTQTALLADKLPVLIHHGVYDNVVGEQLGKNAFAKLQSLGLSPIYKSYPMAHQVCTEQIADIGHWLNAILA